MSAKQSRIPVPLSVSGVVVHHRLRRMAAIVLFVLGAQVSSLSSRLPIGGSGALPARAAAMPIITTVAFSGTAGLDGNVTVIVNGQNFGSEPAAIPDGTGGSPVFDGYTGQDFGSALELAFTDNASTAPAPWSAGQAGNHVGLVVSHYSDTSIAYSFGDGYGPKFTFPSGGFYLNVGDPFTAYVGGQPCSGTVSFTTPTTCAPPLINLIRFGNPAENPTITINGSGFGSALPEPIVSRPVGSGSYAGQTFTGNDYPCGVLSLTYPGAEAGQAGPASTGYVCPTDGQVHYDYLGLLVTSYSDSQIQFTLGSFYGLHTPGALDSGTQFTITVAGVACSGTVSYSAPVYCQNSTWGAAQTLSQTTGSYEVHQTISQSIYGAVTERWYKFLVTPDSTVHVQYSGLPGAVLSLHSDLQSEYSALTNPRNAALQSAKDAASGFLPQSFLPQSFLPQSFLPQSFLPQSFLPQSFLPQSFLPQSFLPQSFLPQSFLPQSFLPQSFLPQSFLPGPYSDAPYAGLLAVSATPNSSVQTIDHDTWTSFGYMYVRVAAPPSASTPFSLTVTESGGVCAGVTPVPFTPPTVVSTGLTTLILWDPSRIDGSSSDISTLRTKLDQFAGRQEVHGAVVDLSTVTGIDGPGSAQEQADSNPACPTAKNLVAGDIKSIVQAYRTQNPGLQYIVLIGDDHSIPFFRYPDESGLGPENQYYPPVADSSASNAGLRDNYVLGQDEYGASLSLPLGDVSLPIPDLAVGRLVRSTSEVSRMLDAYTAANGLITPSSSLITGYDFVADAATNAQNELQAGISASPDTLISPQGQSPSTSWTANDLRQALFGSRHDVVFLAGHFSAGNLEAADYATTLSAAEVASSTVYMTNTLVLALGCHSGYTIPSADAVQSLSPSPDWPEAMAEKGATLLAASGYAYGDTVLTEYGEHLYDNYLRQLRSFSGAGYVPVTTGQADVAAKQEYLATHTALSGVDEKTLLEVTLYGLPMLQVNMKGDHINSGPNTSIIASAPTVSSGPGQGFGLAIGQTAGGSSDIDVQSSLTSHSITLTNDATNAPITATYLTGPNNGEVARPGEPVFPSQLYNVHVAGQVLRGIAFRGGTYTDTAHVTPLTTAVGTETSVGHPAFYSSAFYPSQVWSANFFAAIGGGSELLATAPAQYRSTAAGAADGTLRQFSDLKFRLYYLPSNWPTTPTSQTAVAAAPTIGTVSAISDAGGNVTFRVRVSSDQSAGTQGVWITYTDPNNPGTWQSIDLHQDAADSSLWTDTRPLPSSIVFMVQAANGTGLVSLSTNSGAYYTVGANSASTMPTTLSVQQAASSGPYQTTSGSFTVQLQDSSGNGLQNQPVTVQLGSRQVLAVTDATGKATVSIPLNQPPGTYAVVAGFAGATVNGTTYDASSSQAGSFTITPAPTTLALTPTSGASASYSGTAPITATLTDSNGNGLVQRSVVFTITGGGTTYTKAAITDYLGRAALGTLLLPAGSYSVTAMFGGVDNPLKVVQDSSTVTEADPDYLSSTASPTALSIAPEQATISYSGDAIDAIGTTVQLTATVARVDDTFLNDLSQAQVQFTALDSTGSVVAKTTTSVSANGIAAATFPGTLGAGVYVVSATVVGSYFTSAPATSLLAVYDPSAGFVSGGGWIASPPGACLLSTCSADGSTAGKAAFGFVARYQKGANVPSGDTQFQFQAGNLDFHSSTYQWLVISGSRAQFKGTGTINGQGNYGFLLTAIDGDMNGQAQSPGDDAFRIKIWDNANNGAIVYDNKMGESNTGNAATPLGGGNIIIHQS